MCGLSFSARPRMRFPPPTTSPICTPISASGRISATRASMASASTPSLPGWQSASPETFSRMRLYRASVMRKRLLGAHGVTGERGDHGPAEHFLDLDLVVFDEGLFHQGVLLEELADLAFDDLLGDLGRLARVDS